jgi:hypothetical protein
MNKLISDENGASSASQVCIANIGPQQQRMRLTFGLVTLAFGIVVAALMIFARIDLGWRIALFLPFYIGAIGFFQARDKT